MNMRVFGPGKEKHGGSDRLAKHSVSVSPSLRSLPSRPSAQHSVRRICSGHRNIPLVLGGHSLERNTSALAVALTRHFSFTALLSGAYLHAHMAMFGGHSFIYFPYFPLFGKVFPPAINSWEAPFLTMT